MDICRHNDFCGGCSLQGVPYETQLKNKEKEVLDLIASKSLKIDSIEPICGSPNQYAYRNKMEYTFGDLVKDGEMTLGMHQKGRFMSIVTVDECQLVHEDFNTVLRATLDFAVEHNYSKYHKKSHKGLLRNLIVRRGERTNEILVNIVTTNGDEFDENEFVQCILGLSLESKVVGVLRTINDDLSDAVKNQELRILYGQDFYMEEIMGLKFKVSAFSFFQTNISAVEKLYSDAIELIPDFSGMTVYDLFCGTGTIAQAIAKSAKKAIGVELIEDAVLAARENAKLNNLENCEFISGDVFDVLDNIVEKPDVIIVDPPRKGIEPKTLDKIIKYQVENIVYISCNPKTLIENLYYFNYYGYELKFLKPYDNFPNTKHVETVVLMSRVNK